LAELYASTGRGVKTTTSPERDVSTASLNTSQPRTADRIASSRIARRPVNYREINKRGGCKHTARSECGPARYGGAARVASGAAICRDLHSGARVSARRGALDGHSRSAPSFHDVFVEHSRRRHTVQEAPRRQSYLPGMSGRHAPPARGTVGRPSSRKDRGFGCTGDSGALLASANHPCAGSVAKPSRRTPRRRSSPKGPSWTVRVPSAAQ